MAKKTYKKLKIWQKADKIFEMICEDVGKWPNNKIANAISISYWTLAVLWFLILLRATVAAGQESLNNFSEFPEDQ